MADDRYYLSGVGRALRFLELIAESENGLTLKQASSQLGVDGTSAFRIARTLEEDGYLHRNEHSVYKLGSATLALGVSYLDSLDLRRIAIPRLEALLEPPIDMASLASLSGRRAIVLERLEREPRVAGQGRTGWTFPLHATSLGKTLLAHLPPETVHEWVSSMPLQPLTPATLTTPEALLNELAEIVAAGHGYNLGESQRNIVSVAAPVRNHLGHVVASINATGRRPDITDDFLFGKMTDAVVSAAEALSHDLGLRRLA